MASFLQNILQVDFPFVLEMEDEGYENIFKALKDSGLSRFLEIPCMVYIPEVKAFFKTANVEGDLITCRINETPIFISQDLFTNLFSLPTEGLQAPDGASKEQMESVRLLFSSSDDKAPINGRKAELKLRFQILHDVIAKSIFAKAGSFDTYTKERFTTMTLIHLGVKINWSSFLYGTLLNILKDPKK